MYVEKDYVVSRCGDYLQNSNRGFKSKDEKTLINIVRLANDFLWHVAVVVDDLEKFASMCHADVMEKPTSAKVDFIQASKLWLRIFSLPSSSCYHLYICASELSWTLVWPVQTVYHGNV